MKKKPVANSTKVAVTFEAPADLEAENLYVVGDFNNWEPSTTPMKRLKDGSWSATVRLAPGAYQYRFYGGGENWYNDPQADRSAPSGYGTDNCVVVVESTATR